MELLRRSGVQGISDFHCTGGDCSSSGYESSEAQESLSDAEETSRLLIEAFGLRRFGYGISLLLSSKTCPPLFFFPRAFDI